MLTSGFQYFMKHAGTISKITKSTITVSLEANINCESCKAKAACGVSESNAKEIEIDNTNLIAPDTSHTFQLNEGVDVEMKQELGLKAVFWAYIFPFILLISTLFITSVFFSKLEAGLFALTILFPYYIFLHLLNSFFKKKFKVTILKTI